MYSGKVCLCVLVLAHAACAQQPVPWASAMRQGQALQRQGRFAEAETRFQYALRQAQLPGREDLEAITLSDLASVELDLGQLESAVQHCERAIALLTHTAGKSDPRVQTLRAELAAFYLESGQTGTAKRLLRGITSPVSTRNPSAEIAFSLDILACLYSRENKPARAVEAERESLSMLETLAVPDNASRAVGYLHLATFLNFGKRAAEALPYAERGLALLRTLPNPQPVMEGSAEASLASIHAALGRGEEAERESLSALELTESFYGPNHPQLAWMLLARAAILRRQRRNAEAKELQTRAKRILQASGTMRLSQTVPVEALLPAQK